MVRVDLSRLIGARSKLRLTAGTAPSSTGETFQRSQSVLGVGEGPEAAQAAGDLFRSDDAFVVWTTDFERTSLSAAVAGRRERHEQFELLDREMYSARTGRVPRAVPGAEARGVRRLSCRKSAR